MRFIGTLLVLAFVAGVSFTSGGIVEDMEAAQAVYATRNNYVVAKAAFEKLIQDYPGGDVHTLARAQLFIGYSLVSSGAAGAKAAYDKVGKDYPTIREGALIEAQLRSGATLGNTEAAMAAFVKTAADFPAASANNSAKIQLYIGRNLYARRKFIEAQVVLVTSITASGENVLVDKQVLAVQQHLVGMCLVKQQKLIDASKALLAVTQFGDTGALRRGVDPYAVLMSGADYEEYLARCLRIIHAIPENKIILERVKSQWLAVRGE